MAQNPRKKSRIEEDTTDEDNSTEEYSSDSSEEEQTELENSTDENITDEEHNPEEEQSEQEESVEGELTEEEDSMEDEHTDNENNAVVDDSGELRGRGHNRRVENLQTTRNYSVNLFNRTVRNPLLSWDLTCTQLIKQNNIWVERGGKLLLPHNVIEDLDKSDIPDPYTFRVINPSNNLFTHASVQEFTANPGEVNMPAWMMRNLGLQSGEQVSLRFVSLPQATFCRLEPLTSNFAFVSDTRAVLEHQLKWYFGCLTVGDTLFIHEKNKLQMYKLKVAELRPGPAVSIFECDVELDVVVPEKPKQRAPIRDGTQTQNLPFEPFQGTGHSLETKQKDENKKRDREEEDGDCAQPPTKKCCPNKVSDRLVLIREKQKEFVKKREAEPFTPFCGPAQILKSAESAESSSHKGMELDEARQYKNETETDGPGEGYITENNKIENEPHEEDVNLTELVFIRPKLHETTEERRENQKQVTPFSGQAYSLQ